MRQLNKLFFAGQTPVVLLALVLLGPGLAEIGNASASRFFPRSHEMFAPLLADPRQVQLALRLVLPVSRKSLGEVAIGHEWGLYQVALPWPDAFLQVSAGGGIFARFDLVADTKDLQVNDFYATLPVDIRVRKWSTRILPYHISSHLGDDYVKNTGILPEKHSVDNVKWLVSYDVSEFWRLYGGYNYIIRTLHVDLGRSAFQTGIEWKSRWWAQHTQLYWATDFESWQRIAWNPLFNSQLGIRLRQDPQDRQGLAVFIEYAAGHQPHGQFFQSQETHWVFGLRFELP